nr:immunoglobulin heavy chain junction region [Mus musculus]
CARGDGNYGFDYW